MQLLRESKNFAYPNIFQAVVLILVPSTPIWFVQRYLAALHQIVPQELFLSAGWLMSILLGLFMAKVHHKTVREWFIGKGSWILPVFFISMGLIFIKIQVIELVKNWTHWKVPEGYLGHQNFWMAFFILVVSGPIVEEMLFRGIILGGFLKNYHPAKALIAGAVLFSMSHYPAQWLSHFFGALVSGWLFFRTGSLIPSLMAHLINNFFVVIFMEIKIFDLLFLADQGKWFPFWFLGPVMGIFVIGLFWFAQESQSH